MNLGSITRRQMLAGLGLLPLLSAAGQSPRSAGNRSTNTLVAYFSRSGNTRVIAGQIQRALAADVFEIIPDQPYPDDYEQTVAQASRERANGYQPPLKARVEMIDRYEMVFLGFPIWGETVPPIIRSFLAQHDLADKVIVPFITHGGYGLGNSLTVVKQEARGARVIDGLTMEADQERRTLRTVTEWLAKVPRGT